MAVWCSRGEPSFYAVHNASVWWAPRYALSFALRTCATLRDAIACSNRYAHLTNGARDQRLVEDGKLASWEQRITDEAEYKRVFGADVTFGFGAAYNALTYDRSLLGTPMLRAHRGLQTAYEKHVRQWLASG